MGSCHCRPPPAGGKDQAVRRRSQKTGARGQRAEVGGIRTGTGSYRLQRWDRRNWATIGVLLMLLVLGTGASAADQPDYTRTFVEASKAYDDNRLPEAIQGWESLLQSGQVLPPVLFNLGNAYYRNGNLGEAIRAYRHAQTLAPRDPDIRANLGFAAQTAGISLPERNPLVARLLEFSRAEWGGFATACYGLLFIALAIWITVPRLRFVVRPLSGALVLLLLIALAGLWAYHDLRATPECVVMSGEQKVLSSPLESATPILAIPEGAIVRQVDRHGHWAEIQYESTRGWLPAGAVEPVL